ncbi:hypothetical protein Angca_001948, partial [Angiostrongylus cantonensis]
NSNELEWFRTVVYDRLYRDLEEVLNRREEILRELQEYASLLLVVRNMQVRLSSKYVVTTVSLFLHCFFRAKQDTVVVRLGGDLYAELRLARAETFVTEKIEILKNKAAVCLELSSKIRARMKFIMGVVGEYDEIVA